MIRHSQASYCEVSLIKTHKNIYLQILDDGKVSSCEEGNGLNEF